MKRGPRFHRRSILKAAGISLALPTFESLPLLGAGKPADAAKPPKRFCAIYFPYGVCLPKPDAPGQEWAWFPEGSGRDYKFNESLKMFEDMRDQVTVLRGLSHPLCRGLDGHGTADTFLTGAYMGPKNGFKNEVSLDQHLARTHGLGAETRFTSMALSLDGGVGTPNRSNTLSYSPKGQPIPTLNRPATVFERLFATSPDSIDQQRRGLSRTGSHLDLLLDEAKSLRGDLGAADQDKLDQYLTAVREVEGDVERAAGWLDVPRPEVDTAGLSLDADDKTPEALIGTLFDLIALAFQTDSTRFATFQLGSMLGPMADKFSKLLGFPKEAHGLAHNVDKDDGAVHKGKWDAFLNQQFRRFLGKLAAVREGDGTLLDNTCLFYGSSNSRTHLNRNYPLIVAGGKNMGFGHGSYLSFGEETPLTNLFVTIQRRMGVEADHFVDSTGELPGV